MAGGYLLTPAGIHVKAKRAQSIDKKRGFNFDSFIVHCESEIIVIEYLKL
jgi:hypothetical protein